MRGGASGARHEPDGLRSLIEIVDLGAWAAGHDRAGFDPVTVERLPQLACRVVIGRAGADLACGKAQFLYASNGGVGVGRDTQDDP